MGAISRPRATTVRKLFALSGNRCAFPQCDRRIVNVEHGTIVAEVCHIRAQSPDGLRYLESQSDEERHGFDNLVLMCGEHHKIIDSPEHLASYSPERLYDLKTKHEAESRTPVTLTDSMVQALLSTVLEHRSSSTGVDLRGATLRAGGEGGHPGGSGGGGGVIQIFGITPAALPAALDLDGRPGKDGANGTWGRGGEGGGGGGGGGAAVFQGRPVTQDDLDQGFGVSSLFVVKSASMVDTLLNVEGGVWEFAVFPQIPILAKLGVVCVVEIGNLPPNVLLALEWAIHDPLGEVVLTEPLEYSTGTLQSPVRRTAEVSTLTFHAKMVGVYCLSVGSGGIRLARYPLEVRSEVAAGAAESEG